MLNIINSYKMKKLLVALACALCIGSYAAAQTVGEAMAPFDKSGNKNAFTLQVTANKKYVQEALDNKFKESKLKGKTEKSVTKYAAVEYPAICAKKCDIYTKVDGSDNVATIYLFVSKGYDEFVTSSTDPETANSAKQFLSDLVTDINKVTLKYQIEEQTKIVGKAESSKKSAEDALKKAEDQVKSAKEKLNAADATLKKEKAALDALKAKSY